MKTIYIILAAMLLVSCKSQKIISLVEQDYNIVTEWQDGQLWAYQTKGDFIVGMTVNEAKDDYGKYYQIGLFIQNESSFNMTFHPEDVTAQFGNEKSIKELHVYTFEKYQKMVRRKQNWELALSGISAGLNAASAGWSTTYVNGYPQNTYNYGVAAAVNSVNMMELSNMERIMQLERNAIQQGYIKKHTTHPGEGIIGYMNIKKKGKEGILTVNIPMGGNTFTFMWLIKKK